MTAMIDDWLNVPKACAPGRLLVHLFNVPSFLEINILPLLIVFVILAYKLETPKCVTDLKCIAIQYIKG